MLSMQKAVQRVPGYCILNVFIKRDGKESDGDKCKPRRCKQTGMILVKLHIYKRNPSIGHMLPLLQLIECKQHQQ